MIWPHHAGQERGLAATKSVLGAMTTLAVMALKTGLGREVLSATRCHRLVEALLAAQAVSTEMLDRSDAMQAAAACLADASTHGQGAREHAIHVIGDKAELPLAEEGADKIAQIAEKRALALEAARMDLALRTGQITPAPTVLVDMTGRAPATTPSLMARLAANPLVTLSPARPQDAQIPARLHVPLPACPRESRPWLAVAALHGLALETARACGMALRQPHTCTGRVADAHLDGER